MAASKSKLPRGSAVTRSRSRLPTSSAATRSRSRTPKSKLPSSKLKPKRRSR